MVYAKFINKYGYSKTMNLASMDLEISIPFLGQPVLNMINDEKLQWESKEVPEVNFALSSVFNVGNITFVIYREIK